MPELPEVEHIRRYARPRLEGRAFLRAVRCDHARIVRDLTPTALGRALEGRRVSDVRRVAKLLVVDLDGSDPDDRRSLVVHLKLTGKLWVDEAGARPWSRSTRLTLSLEGGTTLTLEDQRKLGWVALVDADEMRAIEAGFGPDAHDAPLAAIRAALAASRGRAKPVLLDQTVIAGVGNIYADEILFRAKVHPLTRLAALAPARLTALAKAVRSEIAAAVGDRDGIDVPDQERVGSGKRGVAEKLAPRVYQQDGLPCPRCKGAITRIVVAGRGTYLCARCQTL